MLHNSLSHLKEHEPAADGTGHEVGSLEGRNEAVVDDLGAGEEGGERVEQGGHEVQGV